MSAKVSFRGWNVSEDLERQLMLAKNAKQDLKMEVMHLRVLLHQLSSGAAGRTGQSAAQGDTTTESFLRFLPDPMISTLTTATTTTSSPPRHLSRRGRRSSSRDSATGRSKHSNADSSAIYSPTGTSEDEGNGADFSPTSRESLISDISSAELRILRHHKANDMGIAHAAGRSSRDSLVQFPAVDGEAQHPHPMRRRMSDSASPVPGGADHEHSRRSLSNKRSSASVVILHEPVIIGNAPERAASPDRSAGDSVPYDLSASERKILSRRASRDHLASISPTPSTHASHSIIDDAVVGLGLSGAAASPLPVPLPELTTIGDNGEHVPHDLSNSEIKILQRRASSRELGLDVGDVTPTGSRSPVVFDETIHVNGEKHPSTTHLVRTKSSESVISDLSNAELRLLQENAAPGYSKPLADVDAVPRRVHMSKESLVSDLSHTEKKLLVKAGSHSARSSMDDLMSNHGSVASSSRPSQSGGELHGHGAAGHERKVVILARDLEVEAADSIPTGASRESLSSSLGARHVAFSTTDEEHEVDTEGAIRKVAFGASKEHVVDTRDPEEETEAANRPRVVSFEEGISSPAQDHASVTTPMRQSPSPIPAVGAHAGAPSGSSSSAKASSLVPPPLNVTGPVTAATHVPQPESPLPSPKIEPKPADTLEAKAQAIATANPQLLLYMSKAAAAAAASGGATSPKPAAPEPSEDSSDFGAGDTISAASGTTATGTSSK
ncbi:hypothetical protein BCR44DRAFT_282731 [Catenaria anguillulae PL171]|uniref:Uncharacterized protein n=1 Tax=Catenaria anguillulae PL171 TaxID=765915 RepID=A0A1Y2HE12_9FUNG|nr:hypothetical protein BCR44DRAFT_282731 [Catenaria anguillulae PL171]